ncbi:MAG: hypothetical protein ACXU8O_05365 [Asticcacaulis sp.]
MTYIHAVIAIDHDRAHIIRFDADTSQDMTVKGHHHNTAQGNSGVRDIHEFYAATCDALAGVTQILVTGSKTALSDFRHYAEKHRPALAKGIAGYEATDHPSDGQLVALARDYFAKHEKLAHE